MYWAWYIFVFIVGVESYGLVNTSDIDLPAQLYEMELLDLQGNVLARYPLIKDKLRDNIYSISKFKPPKSFFYLKVRFVWNLNIIVSKSG
jgi:hypothetical protein